MGLRSAGAQVMCERHPGVTMRSACGCPPVCGACYGEWLEREPLPRYAPGRHPGKGRSVRVDDGHGHLIPAVIRA